MSWCSGSRYPGRVSTEGRMGRRLIDWTMWRPGCGPGNGPAWTSSPSPKTQDQHLCHVPATPGVLTAPGMDGGPLAHGRTISQSELGGGREQSPFGQILSRHGALTTSPGDPGSTVHSTRLEAASARGWGPRCRGSCHLAHLQLTCSPPLSQQKTN